MTASQLQRAATGQRARQRPPARARPLVSVGCLRRVLLRQASGPEPEKKLAVAVICQAIEDCRPDLRTSLTGSDARHRAIAQRQAIRFMQGTALDAWASAFDLDARFIRELAIKTGYWLSSHGPAALQTDVAQQQTSSSFLREFAKP
jgi:hypothetical protein